MDDGTVIPVTVVKVNSEINTELEEKEVVVTGTSKGKGFAGTIKKWGFHKQPVTRGQSDKTRAPGAIGSQTPGRVFKGKKMAGRLGGNRVTIKGLKIVKVFPEDKEIMVSGPVPGARNSDLTIKYYAENLEEGLQ